MTAAANSGGVGPFDSRFGVASAAVAAVCFLLAIVVGWTGYQGGELFLVGTELSILEGAIGLMFGLFFGTIALVVAFYMDSGFGDSAGHAHAVDSGEDDDAAVSPEGSEN